MCFATPRKVRPPKSPEPQYRTDQGAGLSRPFSFVRRSAMPKRMETGAAVPREASLIVNTHSRKGRRMFREAKALLATAGVELIHAIAVRNPADLNAEVGALISSGAKMVIVGGGRSEEHTSELQSLMRISYAVF